MAAAADADVTYVKTLDNGKTVEATASTPADHVKFQFDGWRRKDGKSAAAAAEPSGKASGEAKSSK